MNPALCSALFSLEDAATLSPQNVLDLAAACREWEKTGAVQRQEIAGLRQQIGWFKRQLFGQKSERRIDIGSPGQMSLGEWPGEPAAPEAKGHPVVAHTRKAPSRRNDDESVPFFDETRVPIEVVELSAPETHGLSPEDYEIIRHKESYRLAQRGVTS
jgi:transposase